jgi:putative membrane protein
MVAASGAGWMNAGAPQRRSSRTGHGEWVRAMGGMMGTSGGMYAWILLWSLLGIALVVTGAVVATRVLGSRNRDDRQIPPAESPGLQEAREALRLRYARGEISREDYLQGKVELED